MQLPLLALFVVSLFNPTPDPYWRNLQRVNLEWETNAEGWADVMTIEVPALPVLEESHAFRGMGNRTSDVEEWRPLVNGHFSDLGPEAVEMMMRIIACESGGNPHARNPHSSATGLAQIMWSVWGDYYGFSRADLEIPELNLWTARQVYDQQGWYAWTCWRR